MTEKTREKVAQSINANDLTDPGIEPKTSRAENDVFNRNTHQLMIGILKRIYKSMIWISSSLTGRLAQLLSTRYLVREGWG